MRRKTVGETKRVVFRIPKKLFEDMETFAGERSDPSLAGLFRWCLAVGKIIWDEIRVGNRIIVVPPEGSEAKAKELVFTK